MDYSTLGVENRDPHLPERGQMHSLYEVCQQVKDGRAARGKQYEVAALLVLLLVAKLAGEQSLLRASEWIQLRADEMRTALQLERQQLPCAHTDPYALAR